MIKKSVYYYVEGGGQESKEFDEDTEDVYLSSKNITHVEFTYVQAFKFLKRLSVNYSSVSSVFLSPLSECIRLESLTLSNNCISEIDLTPLMNCVQLEELDLSNNRLESIDFSQLSGHPTLKKINLGYNKIDEFSFDPLETLPNLTSITLRRNHLQSVNLGPLSNSRSLMNIDLSVNSIRRIDLSPLRESTSFRSLSLAANKLESIELVHLSNVESLESLDFVGNRLRKINLYPLQNCRLLKRVNLNSNELQELDITPLYSCPILSGLGVDQDVMIWTDPETDSKFFKPEGIKALRQIYLFSSEEEQKKAQSPKKTKNDHEEMNFIEPRDFSGKMYELVNEINVAFNSKCYVCTTFLSRKLMENIVISIMSKIFRESHPNYYVKMNRTGNIIGYKKFHDVLTKFWDVFDVQIARISPLHDSKQLTHIKNRMFELKKDFNVDVHELGTFRDEKELLKIRSELGRIISFLMEIDKKC